MSEAPVTIDKTPKMTGPDLKVLETWYKSLDHKKQQEVGKTAEAILAAKPEDFMEQTAASSPVKPKFPKKGTQRRALLGLGASLAGLGTLAYVAGPNPAPSSAENNPPAATTPTTTNIPETAAEPTLPPTSTPNIVPVYTPRPTATAKPEIKIDPEKQGVLSPKEESILRPPELKYDQVEPWLGRIRDHHDAVLTESLFTHEIASMPDQLRTEVMQALARGHAEAIIEQYKDTEAIIGLDPGHGGDEIGSASQNSSGRNFMEKDLTWDLVNLIAEEIYKRTSGKYRVIILRPQNPKDEDINRDGAVAPSERLQKRMALLYDMEEKLRPDPNSRGKNLALVSVHFNDSASNGQLGTEVYWPNPVGMTNDYHRESSKTLAMKLQDSILYHLGTTGYKNVASRGAKEDPDQRPQSPNINIQQGPYFLLSENRPNLMLRK